jgi:O-antigen/teichoic acid export membrane protein
MPTEEVKPQISSPSQQETILQPAKARFAQNIVSEAMTMTMAIIFGLASSSLIVRGLPKTPIYEFYIYVLVFSWIGIILPLCIFGLDVALMKHLPELVDRRSRSFRSVIAWALLSTLLISSLVLVCTEFLLIYLPMGIPGYPEVFQYLHIALLTLPLTALSTSIQGVYRGFQETRFCTYAMGLYHGLYFSALLILYLLGTLTLYLVIFLNIIISIITLGFELIILSKLMRHYGTAAISDSEGLSGSNFGTTAFQALLLSVLGAVFLNVPLLIANVYQTSEVTLAGLGLAISLAVYVQRGQAAPFRALMPRVSGVIASGSIQTVETTVNRAVKLGTLFNGFGFVAAFFFAVPVLNLLFGAEGLVAAPFFMLIAGSFIIYPLASSMMDTLIGLGGVREVLLTYAAWTLMLCTTLIILCPIVKEIVVSLAWMIGLPFLMILLYSYRRRTGLNLERGFLLGGTLVLGFIAIISLSLIFIGIAIISLGGSWVLQIGIQAILIFTILPLFIFYIGLLAKIKVLDDSDQIALLNICQVLHPISIPIKWILRRPK